MAIQRLAGVAAHILARTDLARDDGAIDRRLDGDEWIDHAIAFHLLQVGIAAPHENAQAVAGRRDDALGRLHVGLGSRKVVARLLDLSLRRRVIGKEPGLPVEGTLGERKLRFAFAAACTAAIKSV